MGRVRVPGLNFDLHHLQREVATFTKFVHDSAWMTRENHEARRSVCNGLTFLMLNLSPEVDQETAWNLFHEAMDAYHDRCDLLRLRY